MAANYKSVNKKYSQTTGGCLAQHVSIMLLRVACKAPSSSLPVIYTKPSTVCVLTSLPLGKFEFVALLLEFVLELWLRSIYLSLKYFIRFLYLSFNESTKPLEIYVVLLKHHNAHTDGIEHENLY